MKISVQWLRDYVTISVPIDKLAHKLTMAGLEVEKVEKVKGDAVFETEITPNRPDYLNMLGIARETAAILNRQMKIPKASKCRFPSQKCDVSIIDKEGCPRYIGTLIENVKVTAAPDWIQERISAVDLRPINNIVDITNFCLMETGQPLHAFDYDKLIGGKIIVRRARKGEKIVTIDGVERELDPSVLVIADAKRSVAIAGIMGGQDTEVTASTKNILLESAYFDPVLIRRAARKLGLSSESSYRFERGVDICMVEGGAMRAASLICQIAGGNITQRNDVFPKRKKVKPKEIRISIRHINTLLGGSLTTARCKAILKKLGFQVKAGTKDVIKIVPPSFRGDINREVDVIEEIARIVGYDNLPLSLPLIKASVIPEDSCHRAKKEIRTILVAQGLDEVITYSLMNKKDLEKAKLGRLKGVRVKNPITQDQEIMRPSLLPSLLAVLRFNLNRGQKNIRLFELGKNYSTSTEEDVIGILMTAGTRRDDWRETKKAALDFYDIKGIISLLFQRLQIEDLKVTPQDYDIFSSGEGAGINRGNKEVGCVGKVAEELLNDWDIKQKDVFFAQLRGAALYAEIMQAPKYQPVAEYPAISRDISIAVKKDATFVQIKNIAKQFGKEFLARIDLVEQYLGEKIPENQKGIVFSLTYQSKKRTLTEEEINKVHQQVCCALKDQLGATIR